jgi:hypothetical protein
MMDRHGREVSHHLTLTLAYPLGYCIHIHMSTPLLPTGRLVSPLAETKNWIAGLQLRSFPSVLAYNLELYNIN